MCEQTEDLLLMVSLLPCVVFLEFISTYPYLRAVFLKCCVSSAVFMGVLSDTEEKTMS